MIGVSLIVILLLLVEIVYILKANKLYKSELSNINKKEYKLFVFLPLGLLIFDKLKGFIKNKKIENTIYTLYGRRDYTKKYIYFWAEKIALWVAIVTLTLIISLVLSINYLPKKQLIHSIERPDYNEGSRYYDVQYEIKIDNEKRVNSLDILLLQKLPPEEKIIELLNTASKNLPNIIKGNNKDLTHVDSKLNLINKYPNTDIKIKWESNTPELITNSGEIRYNQIKKDNQDGSITAILTYGNKELKKNVHIKVFKRPISINEKMDIIQEELNNNLQKEKQQNIINLPNKIDNANIKWYKLNDNISPKITLILGFLISILFMFLKNYDLYEKIKKRDDELKREFPQFINKLVLLINAGLNLSTAIKKIEVDYKDYIRENKKITLYEELIISLDDIQNGISEIEAYEQFGRRCKTPEILRFTSAIIQNAKRGNDALVEVLNQQSREIWDKRVAFARKQGEKASSKLILPMGIVFIIILLIVMTPVYLSMGL